MFEAAEGETKEEKRKNTCDGCHLLAGKPQEFERTMTDDEAENFIVAVENVRRVRESGGGIDLTAIDSLTWKLLLIYDSAMEDQERNLRIYARSLFEALAQRSL